MNLFFVDLATYSAGALAVVPIISAIVQAVKLTNVPHKWLPLISIGIGIIIGFIANHDTNDLSNTILAGVMYGLSASGLYDVIKKTTGNGTNANDPQK
jgi:Bacteriophage A118-like holin, Hol118